MMMLDIERTTEKISALISGPRGETFAAGRQRSQQVWDLQAEMAKEFGRLNGWTVAKTDFSLRQLGARSAGRRLSDYLLPTSYTVTLDHPVYFKTGRRPAAIAAHLYQADADAIGELCRQYGLTAREITDFPSWYLPGCTRLFVYEPTPV